MADDGDLVGSNDRGIPWDEQTNATTATEKTRHGNEQRGSYFALSMGM